MSQEEIQTALMNLQKATQEAQQAKMMAMLEDNLKASEASLTANAEKEGVVVTESGLQYKVISAGDGAMPTATDSVTVHYEGRLFDGTVFDSSIARGAGHSQSRCYPVDRGTAADASRLAMAIVHSIEFGLW